MPLSILIQSWPEARDVWKIVISGAAPTSTGRTRPPSNWKVLQVVFSEDLGGDDYGGLYVEAFGDPAPGSKIWLKLEVINKDTGLGSVPFVTSAIVGT